MADVRALLADPDFAKLAPYERERILNDAVSGGALPPVPEQGWYQSNVAPALNAVGRAAGALLSPILETAALPVAGDPRAANPPSLGPDIGEAATKMLLPQTAAEAGVQIGLLGAGPVLGPLARAGMPYLSRGAAALEGLPALGRTVFGTGGAGLGAATEGEPILPAMGKTAVTVGGMEGFGKVFPWLARSVPGAKTRIANQDAERVAVAATEIAPGLGREAAESTAPSASARLRDLATGPGKTGLSDAKEELLQRLEATLASSPTPSTNISTQLITIPSMGGPVSLRTANNELTAIGEGLRHGDIADRTLKQQAIQRDYGTLATEIRQGLEQRSPGLGDAWQRGQEDYRSGVALLGKRQLGATGAWRPGNQGVELDTAYLQNLLKDPRVEQLLRQRLGDEGFKTWMDAVTRGAGVGAVDVMAPGRGGFGQSLSQWERGSNTGFWGLPLAAARAVLPNLGASYVGRQPYAVAPTLQTILDAAASQVRGTLPPAPGPPPLPPMR